LTGGAICASLNEHEPARPAAGGGKGKAIYIIEEGLSERGLSNAPSVTGIEPVPRILR
jgi:hypothetical protein